MRVEARGVWKRFGGFAALRDVSFALAAGSRTALVGPNGSGKTTLIRALMGLLRFEGEIALDGRAVRGDPELARQVAYVPQIAPQMAAPVAELVGAVARLRGIDIAEIEKAAAGFELELGAVAARPFRGLSGGTRQKLLLALALAARPRLLVLDEPTGSLDARSREQLLPAVAALGSECSVILCSHRLDEIRQLVDRVLALHEGRVAFEGAATQYLAATTSALVDVRTDDARAARWLAERGFRRGAAGWWLRAVPASEKLAWVRELTAALDGALLDLDVRDLESLHVAPRGEDATPSRGEDATPSRGGEAAP